jgi:hypothetical protein
MIPNKNPPGAARTVLIFLGMLLGAALAAAGAALAALNWLPCRWFGSAFEGGCGYGAVAASGVIATTVFLVVFGAAVALYLRRSPAQARRDLALRDRRSPEQALLTPWHATFALMLLANSLPLWLMFADIDVTSPWARAWWWAGSASLPANAVMMYRVARRYLPTPVRLVLAAASVVVGPLGAVAVFLYLRWRIARGRPEATAA